MDTTIPPATIADDRSAIVAAHQHLQSKSRGRALQKPLRDLLYHIAALDNDNRSALAVLLVAGLIQPGTVLDATE